MYGRKASQLVKELQSSEQGHHNHLLLLQLSTSFDGSQATKNVLMTLMYIMVEHLDSFNEPKDQPSVTGRSRTSHTKSLTIAMVSLTKRSKNYDVGMKLIVKTYSSRYYVLVLIFFPSDVDNTSHFSCKNQPYYNENNHTLITNSFYTLQ